MEGRVSLVAILLLAATAATDTFGHRPQISQSLPDIRTGEFWNSRRQKSELGSASPDQSSGKRSVIQPSAADTANDFYKPIAEGFETSLVQLRPVYVSLPDDEVDANVELPSEKTPERINSSDQTRQQRVRNAQISTGNRQKKRPNLKTDLKSQGPKNARQKLPSTTLPPKAPERNTRNKHASNLPLTKHNFHVSRATGTPNTRQQGVFSPFNPSHLVRKGVFPPEAFLPPHPSRVTNASHTRDVSNAQLNLFGFVNNGPSHSALSSLSQFSTQHSQGRQISNKKKSVISEKSKFNPTVFDGNNSQKSAKSLRQGQSLPSFGSNPNFRNFPQFAKKSVNHGRGRVTRKLPGSLQENAQRTNALVPTKSPIHTFVTEGPNQDLNQSVNNVSKVAESNLNSQPNADWQGIILSEINKWASTDEETLVGNDTSGKLSVMKSIPARKFTIVDGQFQTTIVTTPPPTQQKRSENTHTEVRHLEPVQNPMESLRLQLENRAVPQQAVFPSRNTPNNPFQHRVPQQAAFPSRNTQNNRFQRRLLAIERNLRDSESNLQSYDDDRSSFPRLTGRDSQRTHFSIDDSFLKQFSQQGSSPRTASITSDRIREVLAKPADSTNLSNLNALNESQKIALLQSIHKSLDEQAVKTTFRTNGATGPVPARPVGVPGEGVKSDRNLIQKLNGKHLFGIQEIVGFKHNALPSVRKEPDSPNILLKKNFQTFQPTEFSHSHQFLSALRRPDITVQPRTKTVSLDEKSLASRLHLQSHFPLGQLVTHNLHSQISAQDLSVQNLPGIRQIENLSHSNFPRQLSNAETIHDFGGDKLKSPNTLRQNESPRASFGGLSQQFAPQPFSPQTSVELVNRNPSSKPVQSSELGLPPRSQRTVEERKVKNNIDIIQLEAVKLASKEVHYPRLPLEAQNALRNSLTPQQDFQLPVSISAMEDDYSTSFESNQKDFVESLTPASNEPNQAVEAEASDLVPVVSSEINTHSFRAAHNIQEDSKFLHDEEQILNPEVPLQRQGVIYRPHFPSKRHPFLKSPHQQSSVGHDFIRVADPPSFLDDGFSKGLQHDVIEEQHLNRFPDIRHLFSDHYGRDARTSPEISIEEDEPNFDQQVVKAPPTFRVPRPIQTHGSDVAPNEVEQLGPVDEPLFTDYEEITERERPSGKFSPHHYYDREPKFFPKNGYNIAPFFRGFPPFGYFHKTI